MDDWVLEIKERANLGKPLITGGKTNKFNKLSFDDLTFIPAQLAIRPVDYFREKISSEIIIGKTSKHPITLKTPIMIAAMSFGSLGKPAKIALAKASTLAGTITNTGEGGMLPEERKEAKLLIVQYSTGRFGINEKVLKSADAIEIKIGQGAKAGQGGLLPAEKVTEEIARIRNVPIGQNIHSPAYHLDIKTVDDLKRRVSQLKETTGGKPIIIKIAAGNLEEDIKFAVKADPDIIAIDCMGGSTAAAPKVMMDNFGIPTIVALVKARKILDKLKAKQELITGGGLTKGSDVAKALALGADAVFMGLPLLISMGCIYCRLCYKGRCPVGIATQDPELQKKLDPKAAEHVANFIKVCTEEVKMVTGAVGKNDIHKLDKDDVRSLSYELTQITGIPFV